ncbi:MAG: YkgJ family cysteine cluster protein [Eubacteriales bacterium]|nr:YkgJ family cysteine cluster protein [Eubacteriales bacterium]
MNKKEMDEYLKMRIGVDEPFKFHCTQCGECCFNRNKEAILITAKDIFNISKSQGLTPVEAVKNYGLAYIGSESRLPIVRLKTVGLLQQCVLLKDNKCSVHDSKPAVCAMFPIGRMLNLNPEEFDGRKHKIEYLYVNPECGDDTETHTAREWLYRFGISLEDTFFVEWSQMISKLTPILQKAEKEFSEIMMKDLWDAIFSLLYLNYDIRQSFDSQFHSNSEKLMELMQIFSQHWSGKGHGGVTSISDKKAI